MIDKSLRKATAERYGDLIVVRMTGGGDCLWMNLYLDKATGQMTCDSDIGSYAYHWGRGTPLYGNWTEFCCNWLSNSEWLLRKCCGERHTSRAFDQGQTVKTLREMFTDENGEYCDHDEMDKLDDVIDIANGYETAEEWRVALSVAADERSVDLPDEWWACVCEDYTPWQKRFAEICREVIVPAIRKMDAKECGDNG